MRLKEPAQPISKSISMFILHKDRYKIDRTYQRESGTWVKADEQYFIDTILRGFAMPPIFLHKKGGIYFIVDGQQRLNTIWKYKEEDNLQLSEKYSDDIINDAKNKAKNNRSGAYAYSELHEEWQNIFDNYPLPTTILEDYDDEEIRDLFRRLQHGKPLRPGEILNAYPGKIVLTMRNFGGYKFFRDIVSLRGKRYKHYYIGAQLMFLEREGIKDISPYYIYDFFEKNKNLTTTSRVYLSAKRVLNYLSDTFQRRTPELRKPGWIITLYLLTSHLLENYSMDNQKTNLKTFFTDFYQAVINSSASSDQELIKFNLAISKGTTSQANIRLRYDVVLKRFLNKYNPIRLDENRLFSEDQKIAIFRRDDEKCQICSKKLIFGDPDTHFHHKGRYIEGGKTKVENGLLVCRECHLNKIHGSK